MTLDEARQIWNVAVDVWQATPTEAHVGLVFLAALLVVDARTRKESSSTNQRTNQEPVEVKRKRNSPLLLRWKWRAAPPRDLMRIDGLEINRDRRPHCAWLGPTGAGKSSAVAAVRLDGARPTLCVTPDISDPLRVRADVIWTACTSTTPINFLIGSPQEVAERLTEVFRSGGVGAWKRTARMLTAQVIQAIDRMGQPRSLQLIGELLHEAVRRDRDLKSACAGWVARFLDLADQFGESIGPDGVDLAQLLRDGHTILLDNDSFNHAALGGDVVALGLAEAKRCASLVPGGFRLIFEEAGQLGERIDLAEPFFRAGRRRNIPVDALTQAESDLNEGISANIATRAYFAQELKSLQKVAADRLGLDYHDLDPASMRDFTAYFAHGRVRRLVRFPKPPSLPRPTPSPCPTRPIPPQPVTAYGGESSYGRRRQVVELPSPWLGAPRLMPPSSANSLKLQELYSNADRTPTCLLWRGPYDKDLYGYTRWNGNNRGVHRVVYELVYGPIPKLDADGNQVELDHTCEVRHCIEILHLELTTKAENSKRRWRKKVRSGSEQRP